MFCLVKLQVPFPQCIYNIEAQFPDIVVLDLFKVFDPARVNHPQNVQDPTYKDLDMDLMAQRFSAVDKRKLSAEWKAFQSCLQTDLNVCYRYFSVI